MTKRGPREAPNKIVVLKKKLIVKIINFKLFYLLFPGVKKKYLFRKHKRPWAPLPLSIIIKWFSPPKLYPVTKATQSAARFNLTEDVKMPQNLEVKNGKRKK